ncbi:PPOX class F420-dependent oxidoreductase [Dermatobacter hominis]|uniref:PPOX class F420-dependent oxidoreductase n=1 Tax=Dermatobacter hominis TaxID=2884263 RepID=UPI001D104D4A|nr:PPOX class F420-dependent oxidoreductase [Dermatobacter hominis]UDY37413.1 PPOX class F420-dependent oxidoreductase [Dermatobacter hominis]
MATDIPDTHTDLLEAPIATLATVGPDGRPQQTLVWFLFEDGRIRISLNTSRQKTKNLRDRPVADVLIADASGYRYLEVRGDVAIEPDDDYSFADRVGAKYGGQDLREIDGEGERRVVVTVEPTRVNAVTMG